MPAIGLVTVLFKSDDVLEGFFKSLSAQTFKDYHLYIIDNSPSEATDMLLTELQSRFAIAASTHVRNSANIGVAKGNNQGIQMSLDAGCSHTLLLNNDIEFPQQDLVLKMFNWSLQYREAIIVPKVYFFDSNKIWMAGGRFDLKKGIASHIGLGMDDDEQFNKPGYFDYAPTCFMLLDNAVFRSVGLMDERYFVYYDDTDFVFRAISSGYKIYYMPSLKILHKVNTSTGGGESAFSIYYLTRNRLFFIRKNLRGLTRLIAIVYSLSSRIVRGLKYSGEQRVTLIKAIKAGFRM